MNDIVDELKRIVNFKDTTAEGDLVLIVAKDPQFLAYALVTGIEKDPSRKKDWWNVHFQVLTIPPQKITWTLREPQFTGQEIFTMEGSPRFIKAVRFDQYEDNQVHDQGREDTPASPGKKSNPFVIVK